MARKTWEPKYVFIKRMFLENIVLWLSGSLVSEVFQSTPELAVARKNVTVQKKTKVLRWFCFVLFLQIEQCGSSLITFCGPDLL